MTILDKVISVVSRETGVRALDASTPLDSLGLDSLEFVCLMQAIQGEVADIPDSDWAAINTVGEIAAACERVTC